MHPVMSARHIYCPIIRPISGGGVPIIACAPVGVIKSSSALIMLCRPLATRRRTINPGAGSWKDDLQYIVLCLRQMKKIHDRILEYLS